MSVISAIGHVALQVRDLDANLEHADRILGLRAVGEADEWTYLTHGAPHHSLQYKPGRIDGLDHIGLEAPDHEALDEVRRRVENEGCEIVSNDPLDPMLEMGLAFTGPGGFLFEVYTQMPSDQPSAFETVGARPTRFGHVNITCPETEALTDFCVRVLDFRISDNADLSPSCAATSTIMASQSSPESGHDFTTMRGRSATSPSCSRSPTGWTLMTAASSGGPCAMGWDATLPSTSLTQQGQSSSTTATWSASTTT